jgi:hypothetical protein
MVNIICEEFRQALEWAEEVETLFDKQFGVYTNNQAGEIAKQEWERFCVEGPDQGIRGLIERRLRRPRHASEEDDAS